MAKKLRLAVLIDAENVPARLADRLFGKIAMLGKSKDRRVYGNLKNPALKAWTAAASRHHIECRPNGPHARGKNVSDFTFVIDAIDLLHAGGFDGLCIVSHDSDFAGLAKYIREKGKRVYGIAEASKCLRKECTDLIELGPAAGGGPTPPPRA